MRYLEHYSEGRNNNFNLIRFMAAFAVVISHSSPIVRGGDAIELLFLETGYTLGHHAVNVFFVVSGFLIARSFIRSRDAFEYMSARALRLIPGLAVASLVTAFIMGPLVTSVSLSEYFSDFVTWKYAPLITSMVAENSMELKGVFDTLPFANELNTPLWTLRWEGLAYLGVMVLGLAGVLLSPTRFGIVLALFASVFVAVTAFSNLRVEISAVDHALRLGFCFLLGGGFYIFRSRIPVGIVPALLAWAAVYLVKDTVFYQITMITALAYTTFWFAYVPGGILRNFNRFNDVSYGIYIYGFPMGQLTILLLPFLNPFTLLLVMTPFLLLAATLSYRLVEAPAMAQRKGFAQLLRTAAPAIFKPRKVREPAE